MIPLFKVEIRKAGYKLICCLTELILQCYELLVCLGVGQYVLGLHAKKNYWFC